MKLSSLLNPIRLYRRHGNVRDVLRYYRARLTPAATACAVSDADYFRALQGRHRGRRGFVVGNGPSLRMEDLDRLTGDVCIASNKIFLAFGKTRWRPAYLTIADELVWEKVRHDLPRHVTDVHTPDYLDRTLSTCRVHQWKCIGWARQANVGANFSPDLSVGAYGGATVTFENIQFAVHLGLNPIYIIGCDHSYAGEQNVQAGDRVAVTHASNHFLPNYRAPGEIVNAAPIGVMEEAYRCARDYCEAHGIGLFNATRGGKLETFERCDLDAVLAGRG